MLTNLPNWTDSHFKKIINSVNYIGEQRCVVLCFILIFIIINLAFSIYITQRAFINIFTWTYQKACIDEHIEKFYLLLSSLGLKWVFYIEWSGPELSMAENVIRRRTPVEEETKATILFNSQLKSSKEVVHCLNKHLFHIELALLRYQ